MMPRWIGRKLSAEIENLVALGKYAVTRRDLLRRLTESMHCIVIETTNICNADCVFCAYQYQDRPAGTMAMPLFEKVIDQFCESGGTSVSLTPTVGDPLVDRRLLDRLAYVKRFPQVKTLGMYTNMISLDHVGAEALVGSGITWLTVSTSGFDQAMYERVYRSPAYKQVLRNILAFGRANAAAGHPVDYFIDMRVDRPAAEVYASSDYRAVAEVVGESRIGLKLRYDNWSGKITPGELSGNMRLRGRSTLRAPRISPCYELYDGPMVYWDGRVGACGCRDVDARELIIGHVNDDHLAAIWLGEGIRQLRREFLTPDIRPICDTCTHYQNVSNLLRPNYRHVLATLVPIPPAVRASHGVPASPSDDR